jgi:hypothetical protein
MTIARHQSPDLKWSFDLPDRLKVAIADAIVLQTAEASSETDSRRQYQGDLAGTDGAR